MELEFIQKIASLIGFHLRNDLKFYGKNVLIFDYFTALIFLIDFNSSVSRFAFSVLFLLWQLSKGKYRK